MFCSKCGNEIAEGAAFCQKCGTKVVYADAGQQPMDISVSDVKNQRTSKMVEDTQQIPSDNTAKQNGILRKVVKISPFLICGLALLLLPFSHLPIGAVLIYVGIVVVTIWSFFRGLGGKIQVAIVGIFLILGAIGFRLYGGDYYVRIVKDGTLDAYPQMTVGKAFDDFLNNPKWESGLSDGVRFVNVKGEILYYGEEAEILIQFIVDEKSRSFQYNACEINGIPQNNLVFWNLLETIYSDSSTSAELGFQGDSNSTLDVIAVGQTQSFDDEGFGNMEVTLEYAQFVDSYQNTLTGGYIYPDEGFVFLWTALTLKNIGTSNATLPTGWSKIVYDGTYEFANPSLIGGMSGIPPLSEPREVALIFMMPTAVLGSYKSLALNIDDIYGKTMLSFTIRPSDALLENSSSEVISGESIIYSLNYKGHALVELLGSRREELDDIYGAPTGGTLVDGYLMYGSIEYHEYNGGEMYAMMSEETGTVAEITVTADATKLNGSAMDLTREEIKELFGEPSYEYTGYDESGEENGYVVEYTFAEGGFYLSFWFPDTNTEAYDLTIYRYNEY